MMLLQGPVPPTPPIGPQFDPNLLFMNDSPTAVLIVIGVMMAVAEERLDLAQLPGGAHR